MRNRVAKEDGGVISSAVSVGAGAVDMAAVTAVATAVAISVDVGGGQTGVGAGAGAHVVGVPGVVAATNPVEESVMSVPHSM